jgi:hypothetical protein
MKNSPLPRDGKRHDYCIACRAEAIRKVTQDGRDYFDCLECGHRAERRLVWLTLDDALQTELTYPVRYVIERHKDELERL